MQYFIITFVYKNFAYTFWVCRSQPVIRFSLELKVKFIGVKCKIVSFRYLKDLVNSV